MKPSGYVIVNKKPDKYQTEYVRFVSQSDFYMEESLHGSTIFLTKKEAKRKLIYINDILPDNEFEIKPIKKFYKKIWSDTKLIERKKP